MFRWVFLFSFSFFFISNAHAANRTIVVTEALWGGKNVTTEAQTYCANKTSCNYKISEKFIGPPGSENDRSFSISWKCGDDSKVLQKSEPHNATNKFILLECKPPVAPLNPIVGQWDEESFLIRSSLVGGACLAAGTLYRGMGDGIYRPEIMVLNFLGDETKEVKSWGLQQRLLELNWDGEDLNVYHQAKYDELLRLEEKKKGLKDPCRLENLAGLTVLGQQKDTKLTNRCIGIACTPDDRTALSYRFSKYNLDFNGRGGDVVITIVEQTPRAGRDLGMYGIHNPEDYIPLVIPARDIVTACTDTYCYRHINQTVEVRQNNNLKFVVEACSLHDSCTDEISSKSAPEIQDLAKALAKQRVKNLSFSFHIIAQ